MSILGWLNPFNLIKAVIRVALHVILLLIIVAIVFVIF